MNLRPSGTMSEIYHDRLTIAYDSLEKDIQRWKDQTADDEVAKAAFIPEHIAEFAKFQQAVCAAFEGQAKAGSPGNGDADDFRAAYIAVLTAYWSLLREVAAERLSVSPYLDSLKKLDYFARSYYARLRGAFPASIQAEIKYCPIIHLGGAGSLTIFNNCVPLVLSVPLNAIDEDEHAPMSRQSIVHEMGHACLAQVPKFLGELKSKVLQQSENSCMPRARLFSEMLSHWSEEIVVDMIGAALAGEMYADSARWITATSVSGIGLADKEHPPAALRMFIHEQVLKWRAAAEPGTEVMARVEQRRYDDVMKTAGDQLHRQFKSFPALGFVSLAEVKKQLDATVEFLIHDARFESLKTNGADGSFGEILLTCAKAAEPEVKNEFQPWGDIPAVDMPEYVLTNLSNNPPMLNTPSMLTKGICEFIRLPWCPPVTK